jgi:hypothetical protein
MGTVLKTLGGCLAGPVSPDNSVKTSSQEKSKLLEGVHSPLQSTPWWGALASMLSPKLKRLRFSQLMPKKSEHIMIDSKATKNIPTSLFPTLQDESDMSPQ